MPKKGFFISFEGIEGSGKSTQIKLLAKYLRKSGDKTQVLWEPGATEIGEEIRKILLSPDHKNMTDETELLLYLAARAQMVREKVLPALHQKKIIISDRFFDSTFVYQGYGAGLDVKTIKKINDFALAGVCPDLTILLDLPVEQGLKRCQRADRIEKKNVKFHQRVRAGYLKLAKQFPKRIKIVKVNCSIEEVQEKIREVVGGCLGI
ncbi:MAG: dTMP kinase [Candidatus Omnitrophota bacterium]